MIRSILLAIFAKTITAKMYDKQIFIKKGDRVSMGLKELFNPHYREPDSSVPDLDSYYTVEGNKGKIVSENEVYGGSLAAGTRGCYGVKSFRGRIIVNCGHLDYYANDGVGPRISYSSTFKREGLKALDFDWRGVYDSLGVVSRENGNVRFDLIRVGQVKIIKGTSKIGERAKMISFFNWDSFIYVAYEQTLLTDNLTGSNILHYVHFKSETTATMTLTKAEGFIEDVEFILDLQVTETGNMYLSYLSPGTRIPSLIRCQANRTSEAPYLNFKECVKYNTTDKFNSEGMFTVNTLLNGYEIAFFYNKETNYITNCSISTAGTRFASLSNCLTSVYPVDVPEGRVFESMVHIALNTVIFTFVDKNQLGKSGLRNMTVVSNLVSRNNKELLFDQVFFSEIVGVGGYNDTIVAFRDDYYTSYHSEPEKISLVISSDDFPEGYGSLSIQKNDQVNPKRYREVSVKVLDDLESFAGLKEIQKIQNYINGEVNQLPIDSNSFNGNNPIFKFSHPEQFDIMYLNQLKVNSEDLGQTWFVSGYEGVSLKGGNLALFSCHGHIGFMALQCERNQNVSVQLKEGHQVVYASLNYFPQENGIVIASSKDAEVTFYYFGLDSEEVNTKTVQTGSTVKEGDVWFSIAGKQYAFWILESNQISLFVAYNKELSTMPDLPSTYIRSDIVQGNMNFCPKSILNCPRYPSTVHILSNCNQQARVISFHTSNISKIEFSHQSPISNLNGPSDKIQVCPTGPETTVLDQNTGLLFVKDSDGEHTYSEISTAEAGYQKVTSLFCARNTQALVITGVASNGDTLMSVLNGNMKFEARNRFHSTKKIQGSVVRVNEVSSTSLIITTSYKGTETFYRVYLNGPYVFYTSKNRTSNRFTFSMVNGEEVIDTKEVLIMDQEFRQNITVTRSSKQNATSGVYEFFGLAEVEGPIFNIDVESPDAVVTPRLLQDGHYSGANQSALNLHEPDFITQQGKYAVGFRSSAVSTLAYFYRNQDQFWFKQDIGVLCTTVDVAIVGEEFAIAAMSTDEGGVYHLRWFIRSFSQGTSSDLIQANVKADMVKIVQIDPTHFAVLSLSHKTQEASVYVLQVSNDGAGSYWVSQMNQTSSIQNGKDLNLLFFSLDSCNFQQKLPCCCGLHLQQ